MTIAEMHTYFKITLNKLDSLNYQELLPEEIDVLLNQEMFKLIEQRAYGTNPKRQSLEETQKRVDDLKNITASYQSSTFTNTTESKTNGSFVELPTDYRHAIQEECSISYTDCDGNTATKIVPVKPITHDRYNVVINSPFNGPYDNLVLRLAHSKISTIGTNELFELLTDGTYTISVYYLRYLKTPNSMQYGSTYVIPTTDVDCELSEHLHREIVELAALTALENVESRRIATYPQIAKTTE